MTNGSLTTFEWDFIGSTTASFPPLFADVDAAATWFGGLGGAALERGLEVQLCLPFPADLLMALDLPAVTNARASGDYCFSTANHTTDPNLRDLGGSALLYDALGVAPSKDVFWTSSPQPTTRCGYNQNYSSQSHTALDTLAAVYSTGPVGFGDAQGFSNVTLLLSTCTSKRAGLVSSRDLVRTHM